MTEYDEYNFDDDDDDDEEEFEKKIYIDDDDDEEEEEDYEDEGEGDNEYEDTNKKRQDYSQNQKEEYEEEEEEEDVTNDNVFAVEEEEEDVSDYEEKPTKITSKKRQPKKSNVETPKKKSRKSSIDSVPKSITSETTTPIKMPTIPETDSSSVLSSFKGIPSAQENLKKKQIKDIWCYICPLCSKTAYNKQTFERHLLLHDDFLTVLQVYYSEEDPVQCLNAAMEEWKVVETEYLKQDAEPESQKQTTFKKDVVLFKNRYYEYEDGKRLIFRKNAIESLNSKKRDDLTAEERLKCAIFYEIQKNKIVKK